MSSSVTPEAQQVGAQVSDWHRRLVLPDRSREAAPIVHLGIVPTMHLLGKVGLRVVCLLSSSSQIRLTGGFKSIMSVF